MNKQKKIVIAVVVLTTVTIAAVFGYGFWKKYGAKETVHTVVDEYESDRYITYNGAKYEYNYNLKNVLFMGVDRTNEVTETEEGNGGQADTLILLSMDKEKKTTTLLEISRDAMTDIKIYDINGEYLDTERAQIALQYAYGDGKKESCRLTKEAVSNMLYEIPIHSYMAVSVDGIAAITELIGGVELTVPQDYTSIDPAFEEGAAIVLKGEQAERYVRYRDTGVSGSNEQRMERQTQFLEAMARQIQGRDTGWYHQILDGAKEYITMNISLEELDRMSEYKMEEKIEKLPGKMTRGEVHDEFAIDNKELQELMIKLFYKSVD